MKIRYFLRRAFLYDKWDIGIYHGNIKSFINTGGEAKILWLNKFGKYSFVADPFIFHASNKLKIFAEYFNYLTCKGKIISIESGMSFENATFSDEIVTQSHMSYPHIFDYAGEKYCIAETSQNNNISLYKYDKISGNFKYEKDLIENFAGVDNTILQYNNKWWLFCTDAKMNANRDLFVFHAKQPLGTWQAHKNNPVKSDTSSARPAGNFFYMDGKLYRPAQNCSITYGGSIAINEVLTLDEQSFEERKIFEIGPGRNWVYKHGMHSLSIRENIVVIDAKNLQFSILNPLFILIQKIRSARARSR